MRFVISKFWVIITGKWDAWHFQLPETQYRAINKIIRWPYEISQRLFFPMARTILDSHTPKNKSEVDPQRPWRRHQTQELVFLVDLAELWHHRLDWASLRSYIKESNLLRRVFVNHFIVFQMVNNDLKYILVRVGNLINQLAYSWVPVGNYKFESLFFYD